MRERKKEDGTNCRKGLDRHPAFLIYYIGYADMAELADALDLGSSGLPVQVQVLLSAPKKFGALRAPNFF